MLQKLSKKITSYFVKKGAVEEDQREVYDYCFEIMLSTLLNLVALIVIGVATRRYIETLIFGVLFMLLRGTAGGYHANTHYGCFFSLILIFSIMQGMMFIPIDILKWIGVAMFSVALIIYLLIAPVDCANNRLEKSHKRKLKSKLLLVLILSIGTYLSLFFFSKTQIFAFNVAYTAFSVSMLVFIGFIKNITAPKEVTELEQK